jgi:uncharacterized protein (DUF2236 family)
MADQGTDHGHRAAYRRAVAGRFAPDAVIRRVDAEGAILLGGGRALLLQLAHPKVAAGVADHSDFEGDPLRRLRGTLAATYTIVFGTDDAAAAVARRVRGVHDHVTGPGYSANDPELLCWVNATLVDTAVTVYEAVHGPLTGDEKESYYQDSTYVAEVLGCPREAQPEDWQAFRQYWEETVAGLEVGATARRLARSIFAPELPWITGPSVALTRFLTIGTLPPAIRDQYGFRWRTSDRLALDAGIAVARRIVPLVPRPVRHLPQSVLTG